MIKKVILFFAVFFVVGLNTAFANEEYLNRCDVVYVSGNIGDNENIPNSPQTPVKDFSTAYNYVSDGGIVVVTDTVKIDSAENPFDAVKKNVIVTNTYEGAVYTNALITPGETDTIMIEDKAILSFYGVPFYDNKVIISGDKTGYVVFNNYEEDKEEWVLKRIENLKRITLSNSVLRVGKKFSLEEDETIDILDVETIIMFSSKLCAEFDVKIFYSKDEGNEIVTSLNMGGGIERPYFEYPAKLSTWSKIESGARILYGKALKKEDFIFDTEGFMIKADDKGISIFKEEPAPEEEEKVVFSDVSKEDWFYNNVMSAYEKGIMNGVSENVFAPYSNMTRAMFVTVLYRMDGEPQTSASSAFSDVPKGSYYEKAVAWGAENKIINGFSDKDFKPDELVSREQMAVFLYRYAEYKGMDINLSEEINFSDYDKVSDFAKDAILWCVKNEIISGTEENLLKPYNTATRAETATILDRFLNAKFTKTID